MWRGEVPHRLTAHEIVIGRIGGDEALLGGVPRLQVVGSRGCRGCSFLFGNQRTSTGVRAESGVVQQGPQFPISGDDVEVVVHPRHRSLAELVEERERIGAILKPHRLRPGGFGCCHYGLLTGLNGLWGGIRRPATSGRGQSGPHRGSRSVHAGPGSGPASAPRPWVRRSRAAGAGRAPSVRSSPRSTPATCRG